MMDDIVQRVPDETRNAIEIVVHIKEDLAEEQRRQVVSALENTNGIIGAEFCPLRYHLVVAKYNKDIFSSQDVLKSFNTLNLKARLIGPI